MSRERGAIDRLCFAVLALHVERRAEPFCGDRIVGMLIEQLTITRDGFVQSTLSQRDARKAELRAWIVRRRGGHLPVEHARTRQIAGLRRMVEEERDCYLNGDRPRWIRLSAQFHLALAELTGNALLVETLRKLVSRTTLMIAKTEAPGHNACSFDEHETVLEALEKGDVAAAQSHMAHHLHLCEDRVRPDADDQFDLRAVLGKGL